MFDVIGRHRANSATNEPFGTYSLLLEAHLISSAAPKSTVFCGVAGVGVLRFVMKISDQLWVRAQTKVDLFVRQAARITKSENTYLTEQSYDGS